MIRLTDRTLSFTNSGSAVGRLLTRDLVNPLAHVLGKLGILREDADYHLLRAAMVIIFFFFGYQKWWPMRSTG